MEHLLLQPYKPCSNFLLWFQIAICQLAMTKATTQDSASIESVKKHFIKIHQTHYHNFILIQSCWITSQSRFQVTNKLIKNSSLSTWTNLENTYTVCKKKFVKFWTNISHIKTATQKSSFGIKSKRIPRLSTVLPLPKLVSTASDGTQVLNHEPFQLDQSHFSICYLRMHIHIQPSTNPNVKQHEPIQLTIC